ncbi:MAG: NusG domain II-containing protein [Clostridiales bacterium]|nr:NusG domain II-containing protein [Clostridiales bacterium]
MQNNNAGASSRPSNKLLIIIISAAAVICTAVLLLFRFVPFGGNVAVISQNGKELYRIDLDKVSEAYTIDLGGNVVLVENGAVSMQSADCPDKLCVRQGKIKNGSHPIICLPNRVEIKIENDGEKDVTDAVVG